MEYQVVHNTMGRFRIRIPKLVNNSYFARRLDWLVASLDFVTDVRINPLAGSMIVNYEASQVSCGTILENILTAIQQANFVEIPRSYLLLER
jgi:Heavy metal associated domain 2